MFSGIVEELGSLERVVAARYRWRATLVVEGLKIGDSVAVSGACLTVVECGPDWLETDLSPETRRRTTLGSLKIGDPVNLERAVRLNDRLSGHLVEGHVDAIGKVLAPAPELRVRIPRDLMRYCVEKGSIAVDGVSLTIFDLDAESFSVAVIPYTVQHTTLGGKSLGQEVNIEVDVTAKHIEKLLAPYLDKSSCHKDGTPRGTSPQ
ncbi:MAG TPA: riboflavin synthase [Acidimicrobiales bacterium]|nr:riboflavin synthase [Acidimicrobiales bacterium]